MSHYYNNAEVQSWVEEYLSYPEEERKTNKYCIEQRNKILKEVAKIINGEIFTHKFTIWENYEDLFQEAMLACIKALEKFNPNYITSKGIKATTFNYFSLTTKRCLKFYTFKNKKFRNNSQIEDFMENFIVSKNFSEESTYQANESFLNQLKEIVNNQKYIKYQKLVLVLEKYLEYMGSYNKRDFFRFAKAEGWSPSLIREFLKFIKEHKEVFYKNCEDNYYIDIINFNKKLETIDSN